MSLQPALITTNTLRVYMNTRNKLNHYILAIGLAAGLFFADSAEACARLVDNGYWFLSTTKQEGVPDGEVWRWVENWQLDTSECTGNEGGENNAIGGGSSAEQERQRRQRCDALAAKLSQYYNYCAGRQTPPQTNFTWRDDINALYNDVIFSAANMVYNSEDPNIVEARFKSLISQSMDACKGNGSCMSEVAENFGLEWWSSTVGLSFGGVNGTFSINPASFASWLRDQLQGKPIKTLSKIYVVLKPFENGNICKQLLKQDRDDRCNI
jgi:hypothetical protein